MSDKVVITGMGWVTPLGHSVEAVWAALLAGRSAVDRITRFQAGTFKTDFAAEVRGFRLEDHLSPDVLGAGADQVEGESGRAHAGVSTKYALGAAAQAVRQSGLAAALQSGQVQARRVGLYLGAGEGTLDFENYVTAHLSAWDEASRKVDAKKWAEAAYRCMKPETEIEQEANLTLSHVAWAFGLGGPASNCLTACAASIQAIGEACELLRRGDADVMLAGGSHSMLHPLGVTGFIRLTAMSSRREEYQTVPRPFDQTRDGFVMGEGAGVLVLERESHARARGAAVLAEVAGYGSSADSFRITDMHPEGDGPRAAMMGALRQAGINPRERDAKGRPPIQYVSAHGTGTKENDKIETAAIKACFGELSKEIPISSVKSMMGHLIAAAGVSNVITAVQAIRTGKVPPTINYRVPDAGLDLDYTINHARDMNAKGGVEACLCNAYGFGGQNDCVVIRAAK